MKPLIRLLGVILSVCVALSCLQMPIWVSAETVVQSDNQRALPEDMGENLLFEQIPMYVEYCLGNRTQATRDVYPSNTAITNGSVDDSWHHTAAVFADYNSGEPVIYKNGEAYCNLIFKLEKTTDISGFCIVHHSNLNLVTSKYEVYASAGFSSLFLEESKITAVDNSAADFRQIFRCDSPLEDVNFFAIKILYPVKADAVSSILEITENKNNYYPRLSEVELYGEEGDTAYYPGVNNLCDRTEVAADTRNRDVLELENNVLFGVKESVSCMKNGTPVEADGNSDRLTDGDTSTSWYVSKLKFGEKVGDEVVLHRDEEDFYVDVLLDARKVHSLGLLYVKNHDNEAIRTMHYKVYAAESEAELGKESSLIADCYNYNCDHEQFYTVPHGQEIKARFYLVRIYDPCFDYGSKLLSGEGSVKNAYPRFDEIAVFTPESIRGSLAFRDYVIYGSTVGAVKPGTKVKSLMNQFTGRGGFRVVDRNMASKVPSEELELGDMVIAETGYGEAKVGDIAFLCDANSSGTYTVSDLVLVRQALLNSQEGFAAASGDTDCNGEVNATDIINLLDVILRGGIRVEDDAPSPKYGQKQGAYTEAAREISVDMSTVLNDNFLGFGTNSFASTLAPESQEAIGFNMVYNELNRKRIHSLSPRVSRMWFQIDWMITDTETDTSAENAENNADYLNYTNGIYDFESQWMLAFYEYLQMLKDADCQAEINFGWKTAERLQSWFVTPCEDYTVGAPKDLDAFVAASVALVEELWERGFDNVKAIAYYNEPNGRDFQLSEGDELAYWSELIKKSDAAFKAHGIRDEIQLWGPEVAGTENDTTKEWMAYQLENTPHIDQWTGHHYYRTDNRVNNYSRAYETFLHYMDATGGNYMVTEMYGNVSNKTYKSWFDWNGSTTGYFIAASNTGVRGTLAWSSVGGYLADPLYMKLYETDNCAWVVPINETTAATVNRVFYEQSLLTNYIPRGSKVLYTGWTGEDIRASAYLLPDGNVTVLVENNGTFSGALLNAGEGEEKLIKIALSDGEDRIFRRISYVAETQRIDANATVNSPDKEIVAEGGVLTDTLTEYYSTHVYTTAPIKKQVEMGEVFHHLKAGESVEFSPRLVDCDEADELQYSISRFSGSESGSISQNGVYTASANAKAGDMIAVRAALKSDPEVYAVAIIYIG